MHAKSTRNFPLQQMAKKKAAKRHIRRVEKNEASRCPVRSTTDDRMQLAGPRQKLMSFWGLVAMSTTSERQCFILTAIITTTAATITTELVVEVTVCTCED